MIMIWNEMVKYGKIMSRNYYNDNDLNIVLPHIRGSSLEKLQTWLIKVGEPKFRAKQIFSWIYKGVVTFDEMTNISKNLRQQLQQTFILDNIKIIERFISKDGTKKYLLELLDGEYIEAVLLKYKYGYTLCVSTQVGCRMGCTFCASTVGGRIRQLLCAEMVGQILAIQNKENVRIGHVVLMGSGEPLDNYDEVMKFLHCIHDPNGLNIGWRNITISTCGMVPEIGRLAEENLPITLAVSLHASDDKSRTSIMPINATYNIDMLLAACSDYVKKTGRRITFEYALIKGQNDHIYQARALATKLQGLLCHVNLIPINPVKERAYESSTEERIRAFQKQMLKKGIQATIRRELGSDINAACGQLRNKAIKNRKIIL